MSTALRWPISGTKALLFASDFRSLWSQFQPSLPWTCQRWRLFRRRAIPAASLAGCFGCDGAVPPPAACASPQSRTPLGILYAKLVVLGPSGILGLCGSAGRSRRNRLAGGASPIHHPSRAGAGRARKLRILLNQDRLPPNSQTLCHNSKAAPEPDACIANVCLNAGAIIVRAPGKQAWLGLDGPNAALMPLDLPSNPSHACFPLHFFQIPCRFLRVSYRPSK
jgi:hypothetical protein